MKKTKLIALLVLILLLALTATALASIPAGSGLGGEPNAQNGAVNSSSSSDGGVLQLFTQNQWNTLMFWYTALSTITGGLLVLSLVRMGYGQMYSGVNPAVRAEFMENVQRIFIAVAVMALAPVFVKLLLDINDAFVAFFADILNKFIAGAKQVQINGQVGEAGVFEKILVAPFNTVSVLIDKVFGLRPIDELIFNGQVSLETGQGTIGEILNTGTVRTDNVFANALLQISFLGFKLYFNAIFTIRKWVIATNIAATPIIVWAWVLSAERRIMEIWLSEIVETVFKQTFYALTFGIYLSLLMSAALPSPVNGSWLASQFKDLAVWLAGFGGAVAVAFFIYLGFKLATAQSPEKAAEAKIGFQKVLIGLGILGLLLPIGGFLASTLSGNWGVGNVTIGGSGGGKITVWEVFFLLLTIIPVGKMMSSIFMSMIARVGTVDEEKVAGIGLGALAGAAGVALNVMRNPGKTAGIIGAIGGKPGLTNLIGSIGGGTGGSTGNTNIPATDVNANGQQMEIKLTPMKGSAPGASAVLYEAKPKPANVTQTVLGTKGMEAVAQTGNKMAMLGGAVGTVPFAAIPAAAPVGTVVGGLAGKIAGNVAGVPLQVIAETKEFVSKKFDKDNKDIRSYEEFLKDFTGAKTVPGSIIAIAATTAGSALGPKTGQIAHQSVLSLENQIVRWKK